MLESLLVLLYVTAGILPLLFLQPVLRQQDKPGATGLLMVIAGVSLWCLFNAAHLLAPTEQLAFVIWNLRIATTGVTIVGWFLTVAEYTGLYRPTRRLIGGLLIVPAASQLLVWTNPYHYLHYDSSTVFTAVESIVTNYGPAFYGNALYLYVLGIGGMLLLLPEVTDARRLRRRQSLALLTSAIPVLVTNFAHLSILRQIDVTSFGFVATVCIIGWALFYGRFLDVIPVARDRLVRNMSDPVVTLDTENRVIDCNPAARELFEMDESYVGKPAAVFFSRFPAIVDALTDIDNTETELSVVDNGAERHFDLQLSPIRDPNNERVGRLVQFQEITVRKKREKQLEAKNKQLDQFASFVSHDLRNPLQIATGHTQLLRETGETEHIEQIASSLERMEQMIADLRALTNVDEDNIETKQLDLEAAAREAWQQVETEQTRLEIESTCQIAADREFLLHIFENLFRNSVEHGANGESITVTVGCLNDGAGFYVEDDGVGIPEDEREDVLEYGYSNSRTGTGFGLSIVQTIVDAHDWTVTVTESDDGGARFEFTGVDLISEPAYLKN